MYEKIRSRKSVPQLYEDKLIVCHRMIFEWISDQRLTPGYLQSDDVLTQEDAAVTRSTYKSRLEERLMEVPSYKPSVSMLRDQWSGMVWPASEEACSDPDTGVKRETLGAVGRASVTVPDGFVSCFIISTQLRL